jgi:hypothetical protein
MIIHRDYPAEPVRLRQSRRKREPQVVGGSRDGDYRPISSAGLVQVSFIQVSALRFGVVQFSAVQRGFAARLKARASLPGTGSAAPPSANLGYSVAHREALLG